MSISLNNLYFSEAQEKEHLEKAIAIDTEVTGTRPLGWYTGRNSPHTRKWYQYHPYTGKSR